MILLIAIDSVRCSCGAATDRPLAEGWQSSPDGSWTCRDCRASLCRLLGVTAVLLVAGLGVRWFAGLLDTLIQGR